MSTPTTPAARYHVRAWATEDSPRPLRRLCGTSANTVLVEPYSDIEQARQRYQALRQAGYFCWVHDTQEDLNVSPALATPLPLRGPQR